MPRLSLRSVPITLAIVVCAVTAGLCLGVTGPMNDKVVSSTRSMTVSLFTESLATATSHIERVHANFLRSVQRLIHQYVHQVLAEALRTVARHRNRAQVIAALQPQPPNNMMEQQLALVREFNFDLRENSATALWHNSWLQNRFTMVSRFPMVANETKDDPIYVMMLDNHTTLNFGRKNMSLCPLTTTGDCDAMFRHNVTREYGNTRISKLLNGPFPMTWTQDKTMLGGQVTMLELWLKAQNATTLWTPVYDTEWELGIQLITMVEASSAPGADATNWGPVVSSVGVNLNLRMFSTFLKTIIESPKQRAFLVVAEDLHPFRNSSVGVLIASSHGTVLLETFVGGMPQPKSILATDSDDAIISQAAQGIMTQGNYTTAASSPTLTMFLQGEKFVVSVSILRTKEGIVWAVVIVTPWSEMLSSVEESTAAAHAKMNQQTSSLDREYMESRIILSVLLVIAMLLILSGAYYVTFLYTQPLLTLQQEMEAVAVMELDDVDRARPLSKLHEVGCMQKCFLQMVSSLEDFSAFMPQAIRQDCDAKPDDPISNPTAVPPIQTLDFSDSPSSPPASPRGFRSPIELSGLMEANVSSPPKKAHEDPRTHRLRQMGFKSFDVSLLCVQLPPQFSSGITLEEIALETFTTHQEFVVSVLLVIEACDGIILKVEGDRVIGTWNAFKPCSHHQLAACRAGATLRENATVGDQLRMAITGGTVLVGFLGTNKLKTPVIVGNPLDEVQPLLDLAGAIEANVVVSEMVAIKVSGLIPLAPVDIVTLQGRRIKVFDILGDDLDNISLFENRCEEYLSGFSRFALNEYDASLGIFVEFLRRNCDAITRVHVGHCRRLVQLCLYFKGLPQSVYSTPRAGYARQLLGWECYEKDARQVALPGDLQPCEALREQAVISADPFASFTSPASPVAQEPMSMDRRISSSAERRGSRRLSCRPLDTDAIANGCLSPPTPDQTLREKIIERRKSRAVSFLSKSGSRIFSPQAAENDTEKVVINLLSPEGSMVVEEDGVAFESMNGFRYHKSEKKLGRGATSEVFLGMADDGSFVALKYVQIPEEVTAAGSPRTRGRGVKRDEIEEVLREVNVMDQLRHDDIVAYLGTAIVGMHLVIITEYVSGGSLASALQSFGRLPPRSVKRYLGHVLRGLDYLHKNGIIHRDIKPHNVLLQIDGQCKLTDFGAAALVSNISEKNRQIGTPLYMAPEACLGKPCMESDIWSLGILTVELLTGEIPWTEAQRGGTTFIAPQFIYRVGHDEGMEPTLPATLTSAARDFVKQCLQRDQKLRPAAETLLNHHFLL